jgi:Cu/Ag efflux pump CusA
MRTASRPGGKARAPAALLDQAYRAVLRPALRMPRWVPALLCVAGIGTLAALPAMHPGQPQFQDRNLVVRWTGAPGMSLPELDRLAARASQELTALPAVGDVAATVGRAVSSDQIVATNSAEIWVTIKPDAPYDAAVSQVRAIAEAMPGVAGTVSTYESDSMNGVLAATPAALTVRLYGSDYGELAQLGWQVERVMARINGLGPPQMQLPVEQPTLNVTVNVAAATRDGLTPGDVRREVATLVNGLTVGNFFEQQKVFDVVVVGTATVRNSLTALNNLLIDTANGGHARLGSLAQVSVAAEPEDITHDQMSPYVDVTAALSGRSLGSASAAVSGGLSRISFPLGYYAVVQSGPANQVSAARLASYVIAALIAILLLAQATTRSWRLALLVLAALPVPVGAGVITALALGARDSLAAMAALLGVLAIALQQAFRVTAAIRCAQLADGTPSGDGGRLTPALVADAAAGAGGSPAITAAAVAAVALLPFILMGDVAGNELLHTAAAVILAGLIAATLVNTLVLPAACLAFGPACPPEQDLGRDLDLTEPASVPRPRPETHTAPEVPAAAEVPAVPALPQAAGRTEDPVS